MGIAAYNRGSAVIAEQIRRDYEDKNQHSHNVDLLQRAEDRISELEPFVNEAISLLNEVYQGENISGFLRTHMRKNYIKKQKYKYFVSLSGEIESRIKRMKEIDRNLPLPYLVNMSELASCINDMLNTLNTDYHLNFDIPRL